MLKFAFSVLTRDGQKFDSIQVGGKDWADAERNLRQMYQDCEVTQCRVMEPDRKSSQSMDIEGMLSLIAKDD